MTTIYVALLNEGTDVWRPVAAESVGGGVFRIPRDAPYDRDDEEWEFLPGEYVRCAPRTFSGGEQALAAVERVAPAV